MSYDTRLRGPVQAITEFGRAAAAGIGLPVNPVTPGTLTGMLRSRKRYRASSSSRRGSARRRLNYGPTRAPSTRSGFRRTSYYTTLGMQPGRYPSKKHLRQQTNSQLLDKAQYVERLVSVPYSDTEQMNARQGRLANVRGVKFRCWFSLKNQGEASNKFDVPIMVRWAILLPKENTGENGDVGPANFFIDADPAGEEATDFPGAGNCFQYHNRQINRRQYGVMQQGKFVLAQDPASNQSRLSLNAQKLVNIWLPLRRQMKWANNTTEFPNTNIYFVCWYTQMGDKDGPRKFTDGPLDLNWEALTYFKDALGFN